jgi:putative thioredoxin
LILDIPARNNNQMTESDYIIDVTSETFPDAVLENSFRQPVLVDFWAAWCQPCQMLMPLLKRLALQTKGAFILAKVNADRESVLATQYGVRGLPTVLVFRNGEVVEELVGVQPESAYQAAIARHRTKPSDSLLVQAENAWNEGAREQALALLRKAQSLEPDNPDVALALADRLLACGETEPARAILDGLPLSLQLEAPAKGLLARLSFIDAVRDAPDTETLEKKLSHEADACEARYLLAARKVVEEDYEAAMGQLLELMRRDPRFGEGAARKGLLAVFDILGTDSSLASEYRRQMAKLLY